MTADRDTEQVGVEGGDKGAGPEEAPIDPPVVDLVANPIVNLAI